MKNNTKNTVLREKKPNWKGIIANPTKKGMMLYQPQTVMQKHTIIISDVNGSKILAKEWDPQRSYNSIDQPVSKTWVGV